MNRFEWTDEWVESLKRLHAEGKSAGQIAKELGNVTRNAVIGKIYRMGLSGQRKAASEASAAKANLKEKTTAKAKAPARSKRSNVRETKGNVKRCRPAQQTASKSQPAPDVVADASAENELADAQQEIAVNLALIDSKARKLSLMELTERTCRWPIGDPSTDNFYYCGRTAEAEKSYCADHSAIAYQPLSSRRSRDRSRASSRRILPRSQSA